MMCYKDMTFCSYWTDCRDAEGCSRPLTKRIEQRAKEVNLPICRFKDKPDCWRRKND